MSISPEAQCHPSAVIEPGAVIGAGCEIGAFCHIGPEVRLAEQVRLDSHVVVTGTTLVGADSRIHSFAVVGGPPQDMKYAGEPSALEIGPRARIREHVTVNTGTAGGGGVTRIGADCLLMAGCHVAHDAQIGDRVVLVNACAVAGHCQVGDDVIIGGLSGLHQFVRIGQGAIIGALTMVAHDVIPHGLVQAPRGALEGVNIIGLKRRGVARADITALMAAFQTLAQGEGSFLERAQRLGGLSDSAYVRQIVDFVTSESDRSYLTPGRD
ncbi:acyl-ACP--UDP-N-acetylglucosamine O-acyltransferase [Pseudooceanicola sp.]|uniref:acyl-ACP--UDP-N-acetylglucosamine O-acyltransferase n=1 Tax=Pseudooceanicola sp. TaxID=1914328 RepID=UPI0026396C42|nr:acyl-ACP--UDP-N-acetylglucosamine O-acyltransferase [Pseudooceanicola sp.]MDF1855810.1 acyl-ACP--UDP-N-acetylglucosamine O-acyltransferase [Pseudooceanicola sp.]